MRCKMDRIVNLVKNENEGEARKEKSDGAVKKNEGEVNKDDNGGSVGD